MGLKIDFEHPVLEAGTAASMTESDLDRFYAAASEVDRMNLFFMLLASFYAYAEAGDRVLAAHVSFLTAYYLFTSLTPPGSWELALHDLHRAIELNPPPEYYEWLAIMKAGN